MRRAGRLPVTAAVLPANGVTFESASREGGTYDENAVDFVLSLQNVQYLENTYHGIFCHLILSYLSKLKNRNSFRFY